MKSIDVQLVAAIRAGASTQVSKLLSLVDSVDEDLKDYGAPPLVLACAHGQSSIVELLIASGADPNVAGELGESPLSVSISENASSFEMVRSLIHAGACPDGSETDFMTPIQAAAGLSHQEKTIATLIEVGANLRLTRKCETPAITRAIMMGEATYIAAMLRAGADPDQLTNEGLTPLEASILKCDPEAVRLLLSFGADRKFQSLNECAEALANAMVVRSSIIAELLTLKQLSQ